MFYCVLFIISFHLLTSGLIWPFKKVLRWKFRLLLLVNFVVFSMTALSFIRDFIKVKSVEMRESLKGHKAGESTSDLIMNHWFRLFSGISALFQVQIIIRILL